MRNCWRGADGNELFVQFSCFIGADILLICVDIVFVFVFVFTFKSDPQSECVAITALGMCRLPHPNHGHQRVL